MDESDVGLMPDERMSAVTNESGRGLVDLAMGLSPVGTIDSFAALRYMERDVLDRWRGALQAQDSVRVDQLVEIAHALRGAMRLAPADERLYSMSDVTTL